LEDKVAFNSCTDTPDAADEKTRMRVKYKPKEKVEGVYEEG